MNKPIGNTGNTASQLTPQLKQDILNGIFKADEKLVMSHLKQRYGVGIGPLREALSQLVVEKLVIVENQRGFRVHPISRHEMLDLYQTRSYIEARCIVQAIQRGSVDWEADVLAAMHRMRKAKNLINQGFTGLLQWETKHQNFHATIASGCGSQSLLQIRQSLYERTARYRLLWLRNSMASNDYFNKIHSEHQQLVDCVLSRDTVRAEKLMFAHLQAPPQTLDKKLDHVVTTCHAKKPSA
ncbi:MAG: GntR family transcriptional regulator [Gammaproteobacteria bacterium]|nr:MAG: GntR family transcriptional regulator [Gammaproteobacteria bacterium]